MLRRLGILLLLLPAMALAQVTWNKDMPPSHAPLPAPKAFTWDLDGTHVVEFTWELGPEVGVEGFWPETCTNTCQGRVHFLHEQCDASCDRACPQNHSQEIPGIFRLEKSEFIEDPNRFDHVFEREAGKIGVGPKYPWNQVAWGMVERIRKPIETAKDLKVQVKWNHYAKGPCQGNVRCHVAYKSEVTLVWEIYRYDTAPDGRQIKVGGGKHRTLLASVIAPQDGVASEKVYVDCFCSIVKDGTPEEQEHQHIPPPPVTPPVEEKRTGAVIQENSSGTSVCDAQTLDKFGFKVVCENMNECTVSCSNPTSEQQIFIVLPGTLLVPQMPGYQDMCCTTPIRLVVPPAETVSVQLPILRHGPAFLEDLVETSGKGRLLCMNIELQEPRPTVGYRIAGSAGRDICALAKYTYASSIRGTHDQVRMWIATDGATFDKCTSVMFPKPREGMYADCLFQAMHLARLNQSDPKYQGCFDPKLVVGAAKPQTTSWLVPKLAPDRLASWVKGNTAAFAPLFTDSGSRLGIPHAAKLAMELCGSTDARVRKAGIEFLLKAVPEASRAAVAEAGGLRGAGLLLMTGSADEAKAAMDVFEAYRAPGAGIYLRNVDKKFPDELKARAAALVKAL